MIDTLGPYPTPFAAAIFDMDGLLIDSEPLWDQAKTTVFARVGLHLTPAMCAETMGFRQADMVRYWFERRPWNTLSLEEVEDQIVAELCGLIASNLQPLPGARALIDLLTAAGMPLAIASSSPAKIIRAVLDGLGMTERFAVVHSAEDEARGKPAPDIYLSAARQLGAPPSRCLAFEDSPAGIRSAFEAGLFVVAVPSPGNWNAEGVDLAHRKLRSLLDFSLGGSSLDVRQEIGIVPPKVQ